MKTWLSSKRPSLLQVIVPASENVFPMVPAGGAISDPIGVVHFDKNGKPQGSQKASAASPTATADDAKPAPKAAPKAAAKSAPKKAAPKTAAKKAAPKKSDAPTSGKEA